MDNSKKSAGIIYTVENKVTGEFYIGATRNSMHQRNLDHTERANRGEKGKFQEAIITYGSEAFTWTEIDTANSIDELAEKEKEYVIQYDSKEGGYNSDRGGGVQKTIFQYSLEDGSLVNTHDCLENAGNAINATKQDISRGCLSVNKTYGGFYWSYEYKEPFISPKDKRRKQVLMDSLDGKLIDKFRSVADASRKTGVSKTCISRVCRGEREYSKGYIWRYE